MPIKMILPDNSPKNKKRMVVASGAYEAPSSGGLDNSRKYAAATSVSLPVTKNAQYAGSGANVLWTQPMFFSPLHTPQNWQIASRRREVYQWSFLAPNGDNNPCFLTRYEDFSLEDIKQCTDPNEMKNVTRKQEKIVDNYDEEEIGVSCRSLAIDG